MKSFSSNLAALREGGRKLRRQIAPFLKYLGLVTAFVLLYGWLFHVIMAWEGQDHSWFTGVYWALAVMSTLGFGDITFHSDLTGRTGRLYGCTGTERRYPCSEGVDIFYLPLPPSLTDKSLAEAAIGASSGLNVIALQESGQLLTNLSPDQQLSEGSVLVAVGSAAQRERFRTAFD